MAVYCSDFEGGFCEVIDYDAMVNELIKSDSLKDFYMGTKVAYEIRKALKELIDLEIIESVDGSDDSEAFAILPDLEASVAMFRASVVEKYGEGAAIESDKKVQEAFEKVNSPN